MLKDVVDSLERIGNRKGLAYLLLAAQLLAVGPMAVLVANPALYFALPIAKLLLLGLGLTLPALAVGSAASYAYSAKKNPDREARIGIVVAVAMLTIGQCGAILFTWGLGKSGFGIFVWTTLGFLGAIVAAEWLASRDRSKAAPPTGWPGDNSQSNGGDALPPVE